LIQRFFKLGTAELSTFYDRIVKAEVFLKLEDAKVLEGKIVEININLPVKDAFAKEASDFFEKALAATTDKLEKQLKKRNEKLENKKTFF